LIRLHAVVEGQTEQAFVQRVLSPFLWPHGLITDARCVETGRRRGRRFRGGHVNYEHLQRDLSHWIKQDGNADSFFTTMIDFYRLPANFPAHEIASKMPDRHARFVKLETALAAQIDYPRFVPYIQMHDFEALLFSDVSRFSIAFPEQPAALTRLAAIRSSFSTPEHIDDGPETAPSKRIQAIYPEYEKTAAGPLIAEGIGIERMLAECPHFAAWVANLRELAR
jgi:hypothetical protein